MQFQNCLVNKLVCLFANGFSYSKKETDSCEILITSLILSWLHYSLFFEPFSKTTVLIKQNARFQGSLTDTRPLEPYLPLPLIPHLSRLLELSISRAISSNHSTVWLGLHRLPTRSEKTTKAVPRTWVQLWHPGLPLDPLNSVLRSSENLLIKRSWRSPFSPWSCNPPFIETRDCWGGAH